MFNHARKLWCALALAAAPVFAQQQAELPPLIKIIVPFAAGATTDGLARATATELAARLGRTVIVENSMFPTRARPWP